MLKWSIDKSFGIGMDINYNAILLHGSETKIAENCS